jgi:hypothetical protein
MMPPTVAVSGYSDMKRDTNVSPPFPKIVSENDVATTLLYDYSH